MFETALPVPRLNDNNTGARPGCDGCQAAKIAEDRSRSGSTHLLLGRQRNQLGKTAIPGVPVFIFPPWVVAAFLFYRFCTFSHLDDFGIINFAWSVFENISDFRRISPTEKCRVIFLVKSARPVLNHHFLTAVHTVNREKRTQGFRM